MKNTARIPTAIAVAGSVLGLVFAGLSTYDYALHLDRQIHDVHCSFIPGMPAAAEADNPCRTAMYSAYAALFRETWWGGIPISLFALGVYAFFTAFAVALLLGGLKNSLRSFRFFGFASVSPLLVSAVMAFISAVKLGTFCKTCVGLYVSSMMLAVGGLWAMIEVRRAHRLAPPETNPSAGSTTWPEGFLPQGHPAWILAWLAASGVSVLLPVLLYISALPDYRPKLLSCGKLPEPADTTKALLKLTTLHPKRPVTLFVDPLCPTCKVFHERLQAENVLENLDVNLVIFPLDNACNWNLDRAVHPGSCLLSRTVICADARAREALEWMFSNQEDLAKLGKAGEPLLRAKVRDRFGADVDACIDAKNTKIRLNNVLQYAVSNRVPVSTPQFYLGDQRVCDEDTDLGLRFTLGQLAPEVLR